MIVTLSYMILAAWVGWEIQWQNLIMTAIVDLIIAKSTVEVIHGPSKQPPTAEDLEEADA